MPADILLYALVAAGLVFWLRGILGTRHGDEPQRPNPFTSQPDNKNGAARKARDVPVARALPPAQPQGRTDGVPLAADSTIPIEGETAERGLMDIARIDRDFDLAFFMQGAQDAFIMIVEAFANGDRDTLQNLLSPSLFASFAAAIAQREQDGHKASVEIHAIRRAEIIDAKLQKRMAYITVRFTADETNILRDKDDTLLSGHPDHVTETVDIWTFGRDVKSRNPAWGLYETRDEDAADADHKTVPDS